MCKLFYQSDKCYWSFGGECKSYDDLTLFFHVCILLECLLRIGSIHEKDEITFWKENINFFKSKFGVLDRTESLTCLVFLTPVQLVVVQFSLS